MRYLQSAQRSRQDNDRIHQAITTDGRQELGEILLNRTTGGIGYIVGAAQRGQGLAARSLRMMSDFALTTAGLPKVILEIEPDNHPSISVARSSGFRPLKSPHETVTDRGRTHYLLTWKHNSTAAGRG